MGRFGLGERGRFRARPDPSNCRRAFFIMRKAVAAIRWLNTLSAMPLAIQKPAGQDNNPAYRRLWCFFVLTKGMSIVGPRPALPAEVATYDDYQRQRLLVKPGMTCYWQIRRNRDSITFDEWVDLDLWQPARPGSVSLFCMLLRTQRRPRGPSRGMAAFRHGPRPWRAACPPGRFQRGRFDSRTRGCRRSAACRRA